MLEFTDWLRLTRVAPRAALLLLVDSVFIRLRTGSGRRAASALTLFGTSDGGGALPPLIAVSAAVSSAYTSLMSATVLSIGAGPAPPGGALTRARRPSKRSSTMLSTRAPGGDDVRRVLGAEQA